MGILRTASDETKRIMLDETDYIEVRADISKREFNIIASNMPAAKDADDLALDEATKFQAFLFSTLVVGWSLAPGQPTVEAYESLAAEAANAVDTAVAEHFESIIPSSAEGK